MTVQIAPDWFECKEKTRSLHGSMSIFDAAIGPDRGKLNRYRLVNIVKMLRLAGDWKSYLLDAQRQSIEAFVNHERTGRSLGKDRFIVMAESNLTRDLKSPIGDP